jgi:small subunit ribosomal protein S9
MAEEKNIQKKEKTEEAKFSGKFLKAIGRRKTSVAQVRLYKKGKGSIMVNEKKVNDYFSADKVVVLTQPLKTTGHLRDLDFSIIVKGGGSSSQAEAIRHGISRTLILFEEDLKSPLKSKGWLTRDSRKKERKKPGLKKARKSPQWSKR